MQLLRQETALKKIQTKELYEKLVEELKREKAAKEMAELQVDSYKRQKEAVMKELDRDRREEKQSVVLASEQLVQIKRRGRKEKRGEGRENRQPRRRSESGRN